MMLKNCVVTAVALCLSALPQSASSHGGIAQDPWNPTHLNNLPSEIRVAVEKWEAACLRFTSPSPVLSSSLFTLTTSGAVTTWPFATHRGVCTKCTPQVDDDIARYSPCTPRMSDCFVSKVHFYSINAMRARHPAWFREDLARLFELLAMRAIRPRVAERISFDEVADAHRRLEAGGLVGKLVLCLDLQLRRDRAPPQREPSAIRARPAQ